MDVGAIDSRRQRAAAAARVSPRPSSCVRARTGGVVVTTNVFVVAVALVISPRGRSARTTAARVRARCLPRGLRARLRARRGAGPAHRGAHRRQGRHRRRSPPRSVVLTTPYPQVSRRCSGVPGIVGDAMLMTYRSFFLLPGSSRTSSAPCGCAPDSRRAPRARGAGDDRGAGRAAALLARPLAARVRRHAAARLQRAPARSACREAAARRAMPRCWRRPRWCSPWRPVARRGRRSTRTAGCPLPSLALLAGGRDPFHAPGGRTMSPPRPRFTRTYAEPPPRRSCASCVQHAYEDGTHVDLCGIDFVAHRGTRVALLGPNGSGKTTLLFHLLGLLASQEGEVRVLGVDPARTGPRSASASASCSRTWTSSSSPPPSPTTSPSRRASTGCPRTRSRARGPRARPARHRGSRGRACRTTCPAARSARSRWRARS